MQPAVPLRKERKTQLNAVQNERERTLLPRARIFVQSSQAEIDPRFLLMKTLARLLNSH
jgi:hypothetical protein